jgi:EAL domain-containing protein (putative c-di-GMP-specific phosphodiesterase class I)
VHPVQKPIPRDRHGTAVEAAVRTALREDRLLLAYQPVVCTATGKVDYFECLVRMRNERGNIVAAAEFIAPLEELGIIGLIDGYVLEKTFEVLSTDAHVRLGFNVSGLTVCDRSWLRSLTSLLRRCPDLASRLVIEITETAALGDISESAHFVETLRQAGCRVALDDFGAGYTSLRHLQALPVQIIKIDGSLIRQMTSRSHTRVFLRHLLGLAKNCGLTTVAECVELPEEAALLRVEGVGRLQGYLIGRPSIERPWPETEATYAPLGGAEPLARCR